jgi:splicing factor U2AF subunit
MQAAAGNLGANAHATIDKEQSLEDFLCFFEDIYVELSKFGRIEALHVVDNLGDHMIGHVYCKFSDEEEASDALQILNGRYYDGRRMEVEFSPVTDFREARCRDYDEESCSRGGFCNFLHVKPVPLCLIRSLEEDCEADRRREEDERRERERRERKKKKRDRGEHKRSHKHGRRSRSDSYSDEDRQGGRSRSYSPSSPPESKKQKADD